MTDGNMDDDPAEQKATHCFTSIGSGKVEVINQQVEVKTVAGDMAVQQGNTTAEVYYHCSYLHIYEYLHLHIMN